ncbi:hypothetical protein C8R47DRAFT_1228472 [Mycena vitilis]|nr:hypothetical protein C8R47DRAFT_1228472 [Mycena vitilis]
MDEVVAGVERARARGGRVCGKSKSKSSDPHAFDFGSFAVLAGELAEEMRQRRIVLTEGLEDAEAVVQSTDRETSDNAHAPLALAPETESEGETDDPTLLLAAGTQSRLRRRPAVAVHARLLPDSSAPGTVLWSAGDADDNGDGNGLGHRARSFTVLLSALPSPHLPASHAAPPPLLSFCLSPSIHFLFIHLITSLLPASLPSSLTDSHRSAMHSQTRAKACVSALFYLSLSLLWPSWPSFLCEEVVVRARKDDCARGTELGGSDTAAEARLWAGVRRTRDAAFEEKVYAPPT